MRAKFLTFVQHFWSHSCFTHNLYDTRLAAEPPKELSDGISLSQYQRMASVLSFRVDTARDICGPRHRQICRVSTEVRYGGRCVLFGGRHMCCCLCYGSGTPPLDETQLQWWPGVRCACYCLQVEHLPARHVARCPPMIIKVLPSHPLNKSKVARPLE